MIEFDQEVIFVSGANGFVGRNVVANLIGNGYKVISLVRDVEKAKKISQLNGSIICHYNMKDTNFLERLYRNSVLIHCAWGDVRDTLNMKHIEIHYLINYNFIKEVILKGVKKILITGTCYEYGLQCGPVSVLTPTSPNTPYSLAKDVLHKSLRLLQDAYDFQLAWLRLFYMYGDGQDCNSVISIFDAALERGDASFNMSLGEQMLDYIPIEKAAEQIEIVLSRGDGVFNVCSGKPISLRRFLENRMKEKNKYINLNLGAYSYRSQDSFAIWGIDPVLPNN